MKILMFGWELPPFITGGLGIACQGIATGLVNENIELSFVIPTRRGKTISIPNVRIIAGDEVVFSESFMKERRDFLTAYQNVKISSPISPYATRSDELKTHAATTAISSNEEERVPKSILDFTGNYGIDLPHEVKKFEMLGEYLGATESFDVIHAHDWLTMLAGAAAKRISGKPLVVHVHATEFDRSGEHMNSYVYDIEKYGMLESDRVIAVSYYTREIIKKYYGIDEKKIEVVHNAISKTRNFPKYDRDDRPLKEKIVLFLGRVTMQKGPDYFVETAKHVLEKMHNVRFVMAGSGDMLSRMIVRVASLRIADRFHFMGFLDKVEVEKMYAMSDLYVMPSVSEPFGLTPFEALLYDIPIIISKNAGVGEILKNAVFVDFWDTQKMADTIIMILSNDFFAETIVERCKDDIEHIGWHTAAKKIKAVYERLA